MSELKDYAICGPASWHQKKAGHSFGSILFLKMTKDEAEERDKRLPEGHIMLSRRTTPHLWKDIDKLNQSNGPKTS